MKIFVVGAFIFSFLLTKIECCFGQLVDGYTDKTSYFSNERVKLYLNYKQISNEVIHVYDASGSLYFTINTKVYPQNNTNPQPWKNGFNYNETCEINLLNFKPGFYQVENLISFIVKSHDDSRKITVVYPSNTINAYSNSGGKSLYNYNSSEKESDSVVSFLRSMNSKNKSGNSSNFNADLIGGIYRWFNENLLINNFTNYICDQDLDDKEHLNNTKLLVIVGHSEYWSRAARRNFDQFILKGNHALVMSGNTMWWQVRYTKNMQGMINYKSNADPIQVDSLKTIEWFKKELNYPIELSTGLNFKYGGYGLKKDKGWNGFKVVNDEHPIFKETNLKNGNVINCPSIEYDGFLHSGFSNDSIPIIDTSFSNRFFLYELLAFDRAIRNDGLYETIGAFVVTQKNPTSGRVIHIGSTNWCDLSNFYGQNKFVFQKVTKNAIYFLLPELPTIESFTHNKPIFFPNPCNGRIFLNHTDFNIVRIQVLNENGSEVQYAKISSSDYYFNFLLELKGTFFLRFELADGTILNEKIILN